jgi:hypothetical protein
MFWLATQERKKDRRAAGDIFGRGRLRRRPSCTQRLGFLNFPSIALALGLGNLCCFLLLRQRSIPQYIFTKNEWLTAKKLTVSPRILECTTIL